MFKYKDVNINYERLGNKKGTPLILLHGWGQNIQMMKMIGEMEPGNDAQIKDVMEKVKSQKKFGHLMTLQIWFMNYLNH